MGQTAHTQNSIDESQNFLLRLKKGLLKDKHYMSSLRWSPRRGKTNLCLWKEVIYWKGA